MTPDDARAEVRRRAAGRTRYEGQEPRADEVLAEEVERLRAALQAINRRASPTYDRTFDVCSRDLYWCACEARRALENDRG